MVYLRRILIIVPVTLLAFICVDLARDQHRYFKLRQGQLHTNTDQYPPRLQNDRLLRDIELISSSGLHVSMRIRLPAEAEKKKVPLVLLLGGHRTGKRAVDLVADPNGIAYAAIDYPFSGDLSQTSVLGKLRLLRDIQRAFLDTPPSLMLAMDWLEAQSWFDERRTNLVGVSLGVPFTAATAAIDQRFHRTWLIHGAVDNQEWLDHALAKDIASERLRKLAAQAGLFLLYGNSFNTEVLISKIAPRPIVMISARQDERLSDREKNKLLVSDPPQHVTHLWTEGRHIGTRRERELNQLLHLVTEGVLADVP